MAKVRVQFKTDKTANWDETFQPLAGELCIFSDYEDIGEKNHLGNKIYKPNIKIGTGNKTLSDLSFLNNAAIEDFFIQSLFDKNASSSALEEGRLGSMILT